MLLATPFFLISNFKLYIKRNSSVRKSQKIFVPRPHQPFSYPRPKTDGENHAGVENSK